MSSNIDNRLILFDLDGTLIDVMSYHSDSLYEVMYRIWGVNSHLVGLQQRGGLSQIETMRRICRSQNVADADIEQHIEEAQRALTAEIVALLPDDLTGKRLPGAMPLLDMLVAEGIRIGLVTGTLGPTAAVLLERSGLASYFPVAAFGHERHLREELVCLAVRRAGEVYGIDTSQTNLVTIGDAPLDIQAGKACGARTVSVATGHFTAEELIQYEPDVILESLEDVQAAFTALVA
jgi:phosphoglycolate phosphatase-like HAD superfamily hydrolase